MGLLSLYINTKMRAGLLHLTDGNFEFVWNVDDAHLPSSVWGMWRGYLYCRMSLFNHPP